MAVIEPVAGTSTPMSETSARENQIALNFETQIRNLNQLLGVARLIPKQSGTTLKAYRAFGTLNGDTVKPGAVIPLSKYVLKRIPLNDIEIQKYVKAVPLEDISNLGYELAVEKTDNEMKSDIQRNIRASLFSYMGGIPTASGGEITAEDIVTTATGKGLQKAMAAAWGKLSVLFEDHGDIQPVYFVNPEDIADYLGNATITTQTTFGMRYVEDFLGLGSVLSTALVEKGTLWATAKENIIGYYVSANDPDIRAAFPNMTTDASGFIGIHKEGTYNTLTCNTNMICGIEYTTEYLNGVVKATIT